ncbi:MAG: ROK family protein [Terriglobia bacterium]
MRALAVDLGGSHATCALLEDRTIIRSETLTTEGSTGLAPVLVRLAETFHKLLGEAGVKASGCAGLAFSFCGIVDHSKGKVLSTNAKYDDAPSLDLVGWCRRTFGIPLEIENDARMALLGEWYAGAARGFDDIVMITLGTGIGGAAMVRGLLLRGKHSQAGCLGGHFPILFSGRPCTCGGIGCAEAEAAGWSLPEICRSTRGFESSPLAQERPIGFEHLFRHADAGDSLAVEVRDRCLAVWAAATVGLIHAYDPEVVVFGGAVMKSASAILPFLQAHVDRHAWTPWGNVALRSAELGNQAALLGAVPLIQSQVD